ncbi:substrate-binding domain-containing protein [Cellulomonas sp. NTE-D12]|uniref:substrate-binding domain-containing protein n=1 Tax=Cellulomonas sp. NTE-D12 TaxID=2962632 RepID=UPI003081541D|nr:sugar ABC transporter substrate-binding protein [Cellulomonas sp. NTE-D12]
MFHIMRRRVTLTVALAATVTLLAACSSGASGSGSSGSAGASGGAKHIRIGAMYLDSQGYYGGVRAGVKKAADASGVKVDIVESTSAGDVSKENSFMSSLIASGVNAIIMSAVSTDGSVAAVKQAHDAGIPVICYNTCVNDDAVKQYVSAYILGDPVKFGQMMGDFAGKYFTDQKVADPKIGVINCEQYEVCQQRMQGFKDALTKAVPGATIAADQQGTESDTAISVGEQILTSHPDVTGMYGQSGGATVGAFKSISNRGKDGQIAAFGSDMTTDIATALKAGTVLKGVVDISGIEVGKLAFAAAQDAIAGKKLDDKVIQAPIKLYTPADAQAWLDSHPDGLP